MRYQKLNDKKGALCMRTFQEIVQNIIHYKKYTIQLLCTTYTYCVQHIQLLYIQLRSKNKIGALRIPIKSKIMQGKSEAH